MRDPEVHAAVLAEVTAGLAAHGLVVTDVAVSPCAGPTATSSSSCAPTGAVRRSTPARLDGGARRRRRERARAARRTAPAPGPRLARDLAHHAALWLSERGATVRIASPTPTASDCPTSASTPTSFAEGLDVVISLGGDGTMLRAVDLVVRGRRRRCSA